MVKLKQPSIAIAIDFSQNSDYALMKGIELAKHHHSKLSIIHVIQKNSDDTFLDSLLNKVLPKSLWLSTEEHAMSLLMEKTQKFNFPKHKIQLEILSEGDPSTEILHYVKKNKIDLLIMGAHGKYSLRHYFVGTTAEAVAKKSKCPVLIVKNKPVGIYKTALIPTDFSAASKKALDFALTFLPKTKVTLLHVGDFDYEQFLKRQEGKIPKQKILQIKKGINLYLTSLMTKFIKKAKLKKISFVISTGYPAPNIIKAAEKAKSDVIVMGSRGKGRHLYLGSVASWVLDDTKKDILLVPPKR